MLQLLDPEYRNRLRAAGGAILPYLTKWAYWRLDDLGRKRAAPLTDDLLAVTRAPRAEASGTYPDVVRALQRLSPRDRDILRWRYEDSLSNHDVATKLGISDAAAKKAAHDARERIHALLVDEGFEL
jgi:RNA polymerase sigma factor (sigma-70 family)